MRQLLSAFLLPLSCAGAERRVIPSTNRGPAGHIPSRYSQDLKTWKNCGAVFTTLPERATREIPGARSFWAPDISLFNSHYHLYYSVSTFGKNHSAMGLATNKTLDSTGAEYRWEDHGPVLRSYREDSYNAIDPSLVMDDKGARGSRLSASGQGEDAANRFTYRRTCQRISSSTRLRQLKRAPGVPGGPIEAPFMIRKGGYYYLFADYCCRGAKTTYKIRCGRCHNILG